MRTVPAANPHPLLPPAPWCHKCNGSGWLGYSAEGDSVECDRCLGWGEVKEPEPPAPTLYVAEVAGEVVDTGLDLESFVRQLVKDWPAVDSDVVVWRQQQEPGEPVRSRLLAALYPGPREEVGTRRALPQVHR